MLVEVTDHSISGWRAFAAEAGYVPDPMIVRAGEVFANGASAAQKLRRVDLNIATALAENLPGLIDFFDLLVSRDRLPLIDYRYTFDINTVPLPIEALLGSRALPVQIGYEPYLAVKKGAFASLARLDIAPIRAFAANLLELDTLRYDWQPRLDDYAGAGDGWLTRLHELDADSARAASFLLGGFIFSGFAQASGTEHVIQPKRSRFFLGLTATPDETDLLDHATEPAIFAAAQAGLADTAAAVTRLYGLPPVLPYLIAQAPADVTAPDLLKRALDFPATADGRRYREAVALIRGESDRGVQARDLAAAARKEAHALLAPYSKLLDQEGGLRVELAGNQDGVKLSLSKELHLPVWLQLWWNDHTPFGSLRKTFRRLWMTAESHAHLDRKVREIWARS